MRLYITLFHLAIFIKILYAKQNVILTNKTKCFIIVELHINIFYQRKGKTMDGRLILIAVVGGVALLLGFICMSFVDKLIVQNNGVFGKISATIFADAGIGGVIFTVVALLNMAGILNIDLGMENWMLLISALVCVGISLITFLIVSRKTEEKAKLIFPMLVVGYGTLFWISMQMTKWMFKIIFKMEEYDVKTNFEREYYCGGDKYYLVASSGFQARLRDSSGNYVDVHKDDNFNVVDSNGNIYHT